MSGYERVEAGRQTRLAAEDHLMAKPFSPSELVVRIAEILQGD